MSDARFDAIVAKTLSYEGVLSDNPNDHGGITKYGITKDALSVYLGRPATTADIVALTKDTALDVYYRCYWLGPRINSIPFDEVAEVVFDFAVNSGRARAIVMLQQLVKAPVNDGILGPDTLAALLTMINKNGPRHVRNWYVISRGEWLIRVEQNNPSQMTFALGWFRRIIAELDFNYAQGAA